MAGRSAGPSAPAPTPASTYTFRRTRSPHIEPAPCSTYDSPHFARWAVSRRAGCRHPGSSTERTTVSRWAGIPRFLGEGEDLVRGNVRQHLASAARPLDLQAVDCSRPPQAEVDGKRALRRIAVAVVHFADLGQPARRGGDPGADRALVAHRASQLEAHEVVPGLPPALVAVQDRLLVPIGHEHVQRPVVLDVQQGNSAAVLEVADAGGNGGLREAFGTAVVKQPLLLVSGPAHAGHVRPLGGIGHFET